MNKFYITTAIPYINGKPHIGHALEYFQADTIRNYHKLLGEETLLLSGADENALKNVRAAEKQNIPVNEFLDKHSDIFKKSYERLGIKLDIFERGSDSVHHFPGVQKLWELCDKNGDIYKKSYNGLYCVGCESFKVEKELTNGKCPEHDKEPEEITEENYFFKLSNYQNMLQELIETDKLKIVPENKKNEILSFIKGGLEDFSISRSKERAKEVGVPVPGDESQVMYVWFDALAIYITGIGYGIDEEMFRKWWPADIHVIGKDINRFHTVYWPAMLLSAGLSIPKTVLVHGFVHSGGAKMSKTTGNVVDPFEISEKYGLEAFRYFMLSQIPTLDDGDFTIERFKEVYNADLANGLGNLVARVAKLAESNNYENNLQVQNFKELANIPLLSQEDGWLVEKFEKYDLNSCLFYIWRLISRVDQIINSQKPWELLKNDNKDDLNKILSELIRSILEISTLLKPFLPETSEKILKQFKGPKVKSGDSLFPRIKD